MVRGSEVVKGMYDAMARGDIPSVLGALDPAVEWLEADSFLYADRNPYIGPQAVADGVFMRLVTAIDRFAVNAHNIIDAGDTVVAEGRYTGTMKATGTPVDAQFAHVWQLRDGRVVRLQQYTDTKQWADAAGVETPVGDPA